MPKKILVVEDNKLIRELIRFLLERRGYSVAAVADGRQLLADITNTQPDLIIMDVMMKGTDGFQACRLLKQNEETKNIPVLLVSAKGQKTEQEEGILAGAAAYMVKPFEPEKLIQTVAQMLHQEIESRDEVL